MIITRTPFRVSFCGGGSDIASFYEKNGGCVISTSIDKYMYVTIHPTFREKGIVLKYSKIENVGSIDEIDHNIFKQCLNDFKLNGVEISSVADVPAGTGLGSSSTFTVGLLHSLYAYANKYVSKERLANEACEVEIDKLREPIGKQDQYAAACGGLNYIAFNRDGTVSVEPIVMRRDSYKKIEGNLMMFYTGDVRSASAILKEQSKNISHGDKEKAMIKMCDITKKLKVELEKNNVDYLGEALHDNWLIKRTLASSISNPDIDKWYETAIKNGAIGGKLLGAGGGGFLLFYVPIDKQKSVRESLGELDEIEFGFDWQGSTIIYIGSNY
jgi:D-glycero-alpha-D-manno-heptose-7-phosphate kinase